MNKRQFKRQIKRAIRCATKNDFIGCYSWVLGCDDDGRSYNLVLGYTKTDDDENDRYKKDDYRLATKVAYQNYNTMLSCDFDCDFYFLETEAGDCIDSSLTFYKKTKIKELIENTKYYLNDLIKYNDSFYIMEYGQILLEL